jgi:hypothetical protein
MSEMIERLKQVHKNEIEKFFAMVEADPSGYLKQDPDAQIERYIRAILEAMREPTHAMLMEVGSPGQTADAEFTWRAMISAALSPLPHHEETK